MNQSNVKKNNKIVNLTEMDKNIYPSSKKPRFPFINKEKINEENEKSSIKKDYETICPSRFNYTIEDGKHIINFNPDVDNKNSELLKITIVDCNETARCLVMSLNYSLLYVKNDISKIINNR